MREGEAGEVTRLAPSPTGALHLGNARTFLVNFALARQRKWRIVLRIEDLDTPRNKAGADRDALEALEWLGISWDEGPIYQSRDLEPYRTALAKLAARALAYPSELSRTEIEAAASAPQADSGEAGREIVFPAYLRPALIARTLEDADIEKNWRFVTPPDTVEFEDAFAGHQRHEPARSIGDFVIWTKRGQPAYQLAVVVDDHRQGITQVVRGDDLLDSTARQILLYQALGMKPIPAWRHLPLVVGPDGRRLAKRHGDSRIATYRARGVRRERIVGLLAKWCGMTGAGGVAQEMSTEEFVERFEADRMPREKAVFGAHDEAWLLSRGR